MSTSTLVGHIPGRTFISYAGNIPSRSSDAIIDRKLPALLSVVVAAGILSMPDPSAGTFHPSTLRRVDALTGWQCLIWFPFLVQDVPHVSTRLFFCH